VTDSNGATASTSTNITVSAAVTTPVGGSGGGGGGAANPVWLLALAFAGLLLGPRRHRAGQ
jgi:hypothetical protein